MKKIISLLLAMTVVMTAMFSIPMSAQAKKKHSSYKACIRYCETFEKKLLVKNDKNSRCEYGCYNYLTLKTRYGKQKALIVSLGSEYRSKTRIYIKQKSKKKSSSKKTEKAVLMQTIPGSIVYFDAKNRTYFLSIERIELGHDIFRLYKYKKKDKKYVKVAQATAQHGASFKKEITQDQAKEKINKKAKVDVYKFKYFSYYKYSIFEP